MHESQLRTLLLSFFPLNTGNWGGGEEETEMSTQKTGKANKKRKISKYKKKERSVIFSLLTLYTSFTFHHFMHFLLSHRHHHRHIISYPIWNNFFFFVLYTENIMRAMLTRWESIRLIPVSMPPHHHRRNKVFIFSILFTIFLFFLSFKLLLSLYFSFSLCSQIKKMWLWYYLFVYTHIMVDDDDKILFISFFFWACCIVHFL